MPANENADEESADGLEILGMEVVDDDGELLGRINRVVADKLGEKFMEVDVGVVNLWVPVEGIASADDLTDGPVRVHYPKEVVFDSPRAPETGSVLDEFIGVELRRYYGISGEGSTIGRADYAASEAPPWRSGLNARPPGPDPGGDDEKPWEDGK
jgi:hypothetical protein